MDDIWSVILQNIDCGSDYKSILLVSKNFNQTITRVKPDAKSKFANHLLTLLKLYPDKTWDWDNISENPNITWEIVRANPDKPWSWSCLSANPNITWEIVRANPYYFNDNGEKIIIPWNWSWLSGNPNITWEIVQANPDKPWDWSNISSNKFNSSLSAYK